jgi:hypothetical protein
MDHTDMNLPMFGVFEMYMGDLDMHLVIMLALISFRIYTWNREKVMFMTVVKVVTIGVGGMELTKTEVI